MFLEISSLKGNFFEILKNLGRFPNLGNLGKKVENAISVTFEN